MSDFENDDAFELSLGRFAMPEPSGAGDAVLMRAARARARLLAESRREERLLLVARVCDVVGLPMLGLLAQRAAGRQTELRLVLI